MKANVMHPSRRHFLGLIGAALVWPGTGRAEALETISGNAFGTAWHLTGVYGSRLERLRTDLEALFAEIDREMSPWRPDSTVSLFNAGPAGWYPVGAETALVGRAALALAQDSDGAFDPTVGPLVAQWGFGPIEGSAGADWRGLSAGGRGISKAEGGQTLDLCGIAKGRALDRAADLVRARGKDDLLIDLGGELKALGRHPAGRDWHIAVVDPVWGRRAPAMLRLPAGRAVATSGLQMQSYTLGGRTYGHVIDPAAREPTSGQLRSVTVLADDAMTADGWATALFAAGDRAGPALARACGLDTLFLLANGTVLRQIRTGKIGDLLT